MGKVYRFDDAELRILEKQPLPLAVYQYVDRHVYTLALSDGFLELFGYTDRAEAYTPLTRREIAERSMRHWKDNVRNHSVN